MRKKLDSLKKLVCSGCVHDNCIYYNLGKGTMGSDYWIPSSAVWSLSEEPLTLDSYVDLFKCFRDDLLYFLRTENAMGNFKYETSKRFRNGNAAHCSAADVLVNL